MMIGIPYFDGMFVWMISASRVTRICELIIQSVHSYVNESFYDVNRRGKDDVYYLLVTGLPAAPKTFLPQL